jgi:riboflavin kinase/FMN adenylyltransferase
VSPWQAEPVRIWRGVEQVAPDLGATVATVGNFDGVHLGHRHVIATAHDVATELGGLPVVVVTFDPHPMKVIRPDVAPVALTTLRRRAELLRGAGADAMLVIPFTEELAHWSPERFVDAVLVDALNAAAVVVGQNFRFGHRAAGDVALLTELGSRAGFRVEGIALDGTDQPWSSTYIRQRLREGDVESAARALGRLFSVEGVVVEGDHRGRTLGYPTANVPTDGLTAVPADGVYAGWLRRLDQPGASAMPAAISVGTNPTFAGVEHRVESYVLWRDDLELYGVPVEVSFVARLRGMVRFDDIDELIEQMARDCERAAAILDATSREAVASRTLSGS